MKENLKIFKNDDDRDSVCTICLENFKIASDSKTQRGKGLEGIEE